jgi:hypothetical protein
MHELRTDVFAVTGVDTSPRYLSYLPITAQAWAKNSRTELICGLVGHEKNSELFRLLEKFCKVIPIPQLVGIDPRVQAKISRLWIAQSDEYRTKKVSIVDMDMVPLNDRRNVLLREMPEHKIVKWGYDHLAYRNLREIGKWPMDGTSGYGSSFHELVNPHNMSFQELVDSWSQLDGDSRANPFNTPTKFSDESLLRELVLRNGENIQAKHLARSLIEGKYLSGRIDRSARLPRRANKVLKDEKYFEFHGPTPFPHGTMFGRSLLTSLGIDYAFYREYLAKIQYLERS